MTHQVTLEQYARLVDARDNWPERLTFGWNSFKENDRCAIAYLTSVAGLNDREVKESNLFRFRNLKPKGLIKLSQIYGLPVEALKELYAVNTDFMRADKRSREVLERFQKFLDDAQVIKNS